MGRGDLRELARFHELVLAERARILVRLQEVERSLDALGVSATHRFYGLYTPTGRSRNRQSLREVVFEILGRAKKPLTKHEILSAAVATGYRFSTDDPLNSLSVILYGKNSGIRRHDGQFTLDR